VNLGLQSENFAVIGFAAGANTLVGGSGNDTFTGGSGDDSLDGGSGVDSISAGAGNDTILGAQNDVLLDGGADTNWLQIGSSFTNSGNGQIANIQNVEITATGLTVNLGLQSEDFAVLGFAGGSTTFVSGSGNDTFTGGVGADSVNGGAGADSLSTGDGNDTLDGGAGNDSLYGGTGNDLYFINTLDDLVEESSGTDSVLASVSGYTLAPYVEYLELTGTFVAGTGNSLSNTLVGNAVGNSLNGGSGIDRMVGNGGNDTYFVDNTSDTFIEIDNEGSADLVVSSVSGVTLSDFVEALQLTGAGITGTGNSLNNTLTGNATSGSTLIGGGGEDTFIGGAGNDWFVIDSIGDSVDAGAGTDSVLADFNGYTLAGGAEWLLYGTATTGYGNSSANTLFGNSLANTLDGGTGADSMVGGDGNDYYFVDHLNDIVVELASGGNSDTIYVDISGYSIPANIENISISSSVTSVTGNSAANLLAGNSLDNTLDGGAGADTLIGSTGNDYYIVDNLNDIIIEDLGPGTGIDSVRSNVLYHSLADNLEYLILGTGAVTGVGNALDNTISVSVSSAYNSLFGGAGSDFLQGSASGKNTLNGGDGIDTMVGGSGTDYFVINDASDSIVGGGGLDGIITEIASYTLHGSFYYLVLGNSITTGTGNANDNSLTGNSLSNTLNGGAGIDTLIGKSGHDYYIIDTNTDVIIEAAAEGNDTVSFSGFASYTLGNNLERLVLGTGAVNGTGNSLSNTLTGNTNNNSLFGGAGNDSIFGGDGSDTLVGANRSVKNEIDTLTGGNGADLFILGNSSAAFYNDGSSSKTGTTDYALITDFDPLIDSVRLKSGKYYFSPNSNPSTPASGFQNLFLELGSIDEMIARFQGTSFTDNTQFSSTAALAGLNVTFV